MAPLKPALETGVFMERFQAFMKTPVSSVVEPGHAFNQPPKQWVASCTAPSRPRTTKSAHAGRKARWANTECNTTQTKRERNKQGCLYLGGMQRTVEEARRVFLHVQRRVPAPVSGLLRVDLPLSWGRRNRRRRHPVRRVGGWWKESVRGGVPGEGGVLCQKKTKKNTL